MACGSDKPLVYTLCQVVFDAVANLNEYLPAFKLKVQAEYPNEVYLQQADVITPLPPKFDVRGFVSADGSKALVLTPQSFTLACRTYESFAALSSEFLSGLNRFKELRNILPVRVGFRCVNVFSREQLRAGPWHIDQRYFPEGVAVDRFMVHEMRFADDSRLRLSSYNDEHDLLSVPTICDAPIQFDPVDFKNNLVLDFDCIYAFESGLTDDSIEDRLHLLHQNVKSVFLKIAKENV